MCLQTKNKYTRKIYCNIMPELKDIVKWLSAFMIIVLVLNIVYVFGIKRNIFAFWVIIIICAIFAFLVVPMLTKDQGKK